MNAKKKKNAIVQMLVQNIALVLLAETENEPIIKKAAQAHRAKLFMEVPVAEHAPIFMMRNTILRLAHKLASCESVEALAACEHYMEELLAGRVMIANDMTDEEAATINVTPAP